MKSYRDALVIAGLVLLIVACYWQVRHHEFVNYDDHRYVTRNPWVLEGLTWSNVAWAFGTFENANWHPVTWLSHMLDVEVFGRDGAGGHHLTNVALHIANTILLLIVLRHMTQSFWRSALVAALFALHPLHVESVAWVSERKDVLSTFFGLLAILAYASIVRERSVGRYLWVCVLFALSLISKPMLVTLPFVLLLLDYWPLKRLALADLVNNPQSKIYNPKLPSLIVEKLPLLGLSIASCTVTVLAQSGGGAVSGLDAVPLGLRIGNSIIAYGMYIWQMIRPIDLIPFYPLPKSLPVATVAVAATALILISALALALWRKRPHLIVGWLWYLGTLVPVIGLVQVGSQAHADRYTYVPLIGLFIMIAWSIPAPRTRSMMMANSAIAAILVLALSFLTCIQVSQWRDSIALSAYGLEARGPNGVIHFNLANALVEEGRSEDAIWHFKQAADLMPGWHDIPYNLGNTYLRLGRFDEAIAAHDESLRRHTRFLSAMINRSIALAQSGRRAQAIEGLRGALKIDPNNPSTRRTLGHFLTEEDQLDEAIAHLKASLDAEPNDATTHMLLGNALARLDRVDEAIVHFSRSLQLNPNEPRAYMSMATALTEKGQFDAAVRHLQIAAEMARRAGRQDLLPEIQRRMQRFGGTVDQE